ncbi:MAG: Ig-like domain-containing protein [Saccharospirillum sp.]|nr:Ig-like domain-containing protein [Saccharospirillum sp.]
MNHSSPFLKVSFSLLIGALLSACGGPGNSDNESEIDQSSSQLELLSVVPNNNETSVRLDTSVEANFDQPIDASMLNGEYSFVLSPEDQSDAVNGSLALTEDGQTLRFTPSTLLQPDTTYEARVLSGLASEAGTSLETAAEWRFTTENLEALGHTQDFWIFERWRRLSPHDAEKNITNAIINHLATLVFPEDRIELMEGVNFTPLSTVLQPELLQPQSGSADLQPRTDIELVAGLLEYNGKTAVAVLATPRADANRGISFDDELSIDLTFLDASVLAPGDALLVDYAFAQGAPSQQDPDTEDGIALLQARMAANQISFFGLERLDGPEVLLYTNQLGVAREGSTKGMVPAKASDMIDGMKDGLEGCNFGNQCVADFFKEFGQGAKSSFDQALENMTPKPPPPNYGLPNENNRRRRPLCVTPRCGENNGDPHMTTFDGSKYDMMAVGEFTLAKNTDMEVQIRTQPWRNLDNASAAVAAAVQLGDTRVTFTQQAPWAERIRINGEIIDPLLLGRYPIEQADAQISLVGNTLQIAGRDHLISIVQYPSRQFLNVYVDLPDIENVQLLPDTRGLLGRVSDNPMDDFTPRSSDAAIDPDNLDALYDDFIDSWRITDATSLFDYAPGENTASFTDPAFPEFRRTIDDLATEERAFAEAVCEAAGVTNPSVEFNNCVFDVGFTGEPDFAATARSAQLAERIRQGTFDPGLMALGGRIPLDNPLDIDWVTTGAMVRQELGDPGIAIVQCPPLPASYSFLNRQVWGNELYRENSNLCRAGVHAGAASYDEGGTFAVRFLSASAGDGSDAAKSALNRNGVRSIGYTSNERSFDILTTDANRSCGVNLENDTVNLPSDLAELFTPGLIEELRTLGASIHPGTTPPALSGTYQADHLSLVYDDDETRDPNDTISGYQYQFDNQNPDGSIDYEYRGLHDSESDTGIASRAYITGNRDCFSVFASFEDVSPGGCTRTGFEIISGRLNGDRILGFDNALQFYRAFSGTNCTGESPGTRTVITNTQAVNRH